MSIPFGFQPPSGEGDPMNQIGKALEQLGKMMSAGSDGSVNWLAVSDIAKQAIDAQGDVLPTMHESSSTQTAGRTVDLWLDQVMGLPSIGLDLESWSRKNFVDNTIDSWKLLSDPVLRRMTDSMTSMMPGSEALPQEVAAMAAPMMNMLKGNLGATPYKVLYNPRKEPNWVIEDKDADNTFREIIYSVGKELITPHLYYKTLT